MAALSAYSSPGSAGTYTTPLATATEAATSVRSLTRHRHFPVAALNAYTVPFTAATYTVPFRTAGEPNTEAPVRYTHRWMPCTTPIAYTRLPSDPT